MQGMQSILVFLPVMGIAHRISLFWTVCVQCMTVSEVLACSNSHYFNEEIGDSDTLSPFLYQKDLKHVRSECVNCHQIEVML